MWKPISAKERNRMAAHAARLMKDPLLFKDCMRRAVKAWPVSCEVNLSNTSNNRIAWLGHAGCFHGVGSHEDATRQGWHYLTAEQQDAANRVAAEVIEEWEAQYAEAQTG